MKTFSLVLNIGLLLLLAQSVFVYKTEHKRVMELEQQYMMASQATMSCVRRFDAFIDEVNKKVGEANKTLEESLNESAAPSP